MRAVFLRSVGFYFLWLGQSLIPGKYHGAPLSLRRLLFLLLLYPLLLGLQLIHWFSFLVDECLFRGYRQVKVKDPLFVTGIPRSGTTFVHRTLAKDPQFTSFSTWEALLAPSVFERKIIRRLIQIDKILGSPGSKLLNLSIRKISGNFNNIHEIDLKAPEEDYLALLPAGGCFILLLAFPFSPWLQQIGMLDQMPSTARAQLLNFYQRLLQKHLYCSPTGQRLLSKNASFGSWAPYLAQQFPDAKFLLCVRNPHSALSSQLSSLTSARQLFGTDPDGSVTAKLFTEIFNHNYAGLAQFCEQTEQTTATVIDQETLKTKPDTLLREALQQLQIPISRQLDQKLSQLPSGTASNHQYSPKDFPLDEDKIEVCIKSSYELILASRKRIPNHSH